MCQHQALRALVVPKDRLAAPRAAGTRPGQRLPIDPSGQGEVVMIKEEAGGSPRLGSPAVCWGRAPAPGAGWGGEPGQGPGPLGEASAKPKARRVPQAALQQGDRGPGWAGFPATGGPRSRGAAGPQRPGRWAPSAVAAASRSPTSSRGLWILVAAPVSGLEPPRSWLSPVRTLRGAWLLFSLLKSEPPGRLGL